MDELPTPPNPFLAGEAGTALALPSLFELFFLPGDWAIYFAARSAPAVAEWLGVGPDDYGTSLAGFISLAVWLLTFVGLIIAWASIRSFDRAVTRGIAAGYAEVLRHIRMVVALASYRRRQRLKRVVPTMGAADANEKGLKPSSSSHLYE
jgi:hypothetical protein